MDLNHFPEECPCSCPRSFSPCVRTDSRRDQLLRLPQCERLTWPHHVSTPGKLCSLVLRIHHKDMFSFPSKSINLTEKHTEMKKKQKPTTHHIIVKLGVVIATHILCWAQSYYPFFMRLSVKFRKNKQTQDTFLFMRERRLLPCWVLPSHSRCREEVAVKSPGKASIGTWTKSVPFSGWWRASGLSYMWGWSDCLPGNFKVVFVSESRKWGICCKSKLPWNFSSSGSWSIWM